jgi:hypothetical protein
MMTWNFGEGFASYRYGVAISEVRKLPLELIDFSQEKTLRPTDQSVLVVA